MYQTLSKYTKLLATACEDLNVVSDTHKSHMLTVVNSYNQIINDILRKINGNISAPSDPVKVEEIEELQELELETPGVQQKQEQTSEERLEEMEAEEEKQQQVIEDKKLSRKEQIEIWRKNSAIGNECLQAIQQLKDGEHSIKLRLEPVQAVVEHINNVMYKDQSSLYTANGGEGLQKALEFLRKLMED